MSLPSHEFAHLIAPIQNILSATNNFAQENAITSSGFAKNYRGQLLWSGELIDITAQRFNKERNDREQQFWTEISMLSSLKHKNLVSLVGFCDENDEKIIIYKNETARGLLYKYISDPMLLTWVRRLEISVGLAHALSYIHYDEPRDFSVIHRAIDCSRVLLNDKWEPKLYGFEHSMKIKASQRHHSFHTNRVQGVNGYADPTYLETKRVSHKSDMYSFGIVLFELLCGRESIIDSDTNKYLAPVAATHYREKRLDEIIDWDLWKQMDSRSFNIFAETAYDCLNEERSQRPNIDEIVTRLEKALDYQNAEDYEKWEPKLPKDYKEIIQMSKCPDDYSTIKKEDLYNIFSKGFSFTDKVLLSFDGDRERNELVSATMFSYIGSCPHELKSLPESRSFSSKPVYVNLKYRKGHKSLHAYFATWRDEQWMMIELHRFSDQNEDVIFAFLLESFSSYYCGDAAVYIEGIEFRAIDKVKHEEIGNLKEAQQALKSDFNVDQVQQLPTNFEEIFKVSRNYDELFWLGEVDGKKLLVLSAKAALYKFTNVKTFTSKPPAQSSFQELSEKLQGICIVQVKVRDILHQENKEAEFLYFITPEPSNIHDITRVPKQREDGWMEIQLWKFNSAHEFKDDSLSMNMKFTSHEGTMSGLIVCGLEFRPL
ncbi:kinase-like domain, phloem protein 2-like protein [Tanacetum coccineum]|uniref:Kinase-like domain, phloem protein 2-like protein n=1 Tax=Tanacetum coccineum TaxID=301880 RepID=A0ABQ4ZYI7_9ASTR